MAELLTLEQTSAAISSGQRLIIAGDEALLRALPQGSWIGGTTAYFMTGEGAKFDREHLLVTTLHAPILDVDIRTYAPEQLAEIPRNYPAQGCSFIIVPVNSTAHLRFACECMTYEGLFNQPLVGWNSGGVLSELDSTKALVFDGARGQSFENRAVVLHGSLAPEFVARVEIINPYAQGDGDVITFPTDGFVVSDCTINGEVQNFAEYLLRQSIDTRWPLVADYGGAKINVSFRRLKLGDRSVTLASPVFEGVEYRLGRPALDLEQAFTGKQYLEAGSPVFSCNCVLNYLYANLEGKQIGQLSGPIVFGEIAYIQLNQTLVYVCFERHVSAPSV
jgi:hypothetical protein